MIDHNCKAAVEDEARLAALNLSGLLDSPPEEIFDRFTRLASTILDVPVSLVSLVDTDRQFFKSCFGLGEPWATKRQTPLTHSFCKHVVATEQPLVVTDARQHPELQSNLAVPELGVVAYLGIPLRNTEGQILGSFCVIDDVPRHWSEKEILIVRELAALVISKIELRTAAQTLHTDYLKLRQLEMHRDEMVHMLVHDMRNPLTSFLGGVALAQNDPGLNDQYKGYLQIAQEGGDILLRMINSILEVSKAESGHLNLEIGQIRSDELVETACRQMLPMAEEAGISLVKHAVGDAEIEADSDRLRQVLVNLIANALQHTPSGGEVVVSATSNGTDRVHFSVADSGLGIPEEAFEQLFDKFSQPRIKKERGRSTGLGLPFSRLVIEAHGGEIWVESQLGKGSCFSFVVPKGSNGV